MNHTLLWNEFKNICGDMAITNPNSEEKTIREVMEVFEEMHYIKSLRDKEKEELCTDDKCKKRHMCSTQKKDCLFERVSNDKILKNK